MLQEDFLAGFVATSRRDTQSFCTQFSQTSLVLCCMGSSQSDRPTCVTTHLGPECVELAGRLCLTSWGVEPGSVSRSVPLGVVQLHLCALCRPLWFSGATTHRPRQAPGSDASNRRALLVPPVAKALGKDEAAGMGARGE